MIWMAIPYGGSTEGSENNMFKKIKAICEPYQNSILFDVDIFET